DHVDRVHSSFEKMGQDETKPRLRGYSTMGSTPLQQSKVKHLPSFACSHQFHVGNNYEKMEEML
ncbi:hypothetical protein COZ26_01040, partial [Candidatus Kuenenbacteria bacterium CG_4_10_14_3_um_filter_39_14]